jgi:hypothetical protein
MRGEVTVVPGVVEGTGDWPRAAAATRDAEPTLAAAAVVVVEGSASAGTPNTARASASVAYHVHVTSRASSAKRLETSPTE